MWSRVGPKKAMLNKESREVVTFCWSEESCFHIIPSSPMPGKPMTLNGPRPAAFRWEFSFRSGLQGGECCLCCWCVSRSLMEWSEITHVFEAVQILVTLSTNVTLIRLLLLHTQCSRIWCRGFWVDNRECSISIFMQLLSLMSVCLVISGKISNANCGYEHLTYLRPFWFLYAFSHPMTGHLKGLCSSPIIIKAAVVWGSVPPIPFIPIICCWR